MKDQNVTPDTLEQAIAAIKADKPSLAELANAGERARIALAAQRGPKAVVTQVVTQVATQIATPVATANAAPAMAERWDSIEDYVAAIPAYLAQQLSASQTLLFEEESRQSIPLRRALNEARQGPSAQHSAVAKASGMHRNSWLAAAAAVAAIAIGIFIVAPELPSFDQSRVAHVDEIDGQLYHMVDGRLETLTPGTWLDGRQRLRSANGSTAIITLDDGSQIEVDERSEISMTRRSSGNRIDVSRGRILVVASPQGSGTMDVFTDEFMVSVTGTIFEVAHGAKGSRVAVVEGEVHVHQQGNTTSLTPGNAMASRMDFMTRTVADEIAWSRDADKYIAMLQEVAALQQDLQAVMVSPPRYSTRLLDLAPADTAVYIAVPNAPEKVAEIYDVIRSRAQSSEFLAAAWTDFETALEGQYLDEIMSWMREIGYVLGEETVFAMTMKTVAGEPITVPIVLSEVDAAAFVASFEDQLQRVRDVLAVEGLDVDLEVALINDPADAVDGQLSIWLHDNILVATVDAATMREMKNVVANKGSAFKGSAFHQLLLSSYESGTQIFGAVDIAMLRAPLEFPGDDLEQAGLANAKYLIAQHQQSNGAATISADLYFAGQTQGLMSMLSTPGPMGSLEFFSVDTTIVAAMLMRDPAAMLGEFQANEIPNEIVTAAELELFNSTIAVLGGELALGLDGPALPTPAWKVVVEAYDAATLQNSIVQAVDRFNRYAAANAVGGTISLAAANVGGYDGYRLNLAVDTAVAAGRLENVSINYAYVDGYLIAAPNLAVVDRAITIYESGANLPTSQDFRELLSRDGYLDYSAIYYSKLGALVNDVMQNLPATLTTEQQAAVAALDTDVGAAMGSVLALPDKLHFAYSGSSQLPVNMLSQLIRLAPLFESMAAQDPAQ